MGDQSHLTDHDLLLILNANVESLAKRLQGYVPEACVQHTAQILSMQRELEAQRVTLASIEAAHKADTEAVNKSISQEIEKVYNRLWVLVGFVLAPVAAAAIYHLLK